MIRAMVAPARIALSILVSALLSACVSPPAGISYSGPVRPSADVAFFYDDTWTDAENVRHVEQQIFDEVERLIAGATEFLLLDMFLFNDFQGKSPETTRPLSSELTQHLVNRKKAVPELEVIVITDPINRVYGGADSSHFQRLMANGVRVVETDLDILRDSNPAYSLLWRLFVRPFGTGPGGLVGNPFGEGRVSVRSWLKMLNFKANHRKVVIADQGNGRLVGLVTSANPHDGSSAHRNSAARFSGDAVVDLLETEIAVLTFSGADRPVFEPAPQSDLPQSETSVQLLTEKAIETALIAELEKVELGDRVDVMMFYLSDRAVIGALKEAHMRGGTIRVLLDPNKDAFGWRKNGIPNRPVARELHNAGIAVRWCDTHGEQCHAKTVGVHYANGASVVLTGSANFTRRNLDDFNLETNVLIRTSARTAAVVAAGRYFEDMWGNDAGRHQSVAYSVYEDRSLFRRLIYRFQEATGLCTF